MIRRRSILLWVLVGLAVAGPAAARQFNLYRGEDTRFDVSTRRGLRFRVDDPQLELRVGGRLHLDAVHFDDDASSNDDEIDLRRGRLYLAGRFLEDWSFKIERELTADRSGWRNLWLQYRPGSDVRIRGGNFVAPFGLEDFSSSNHSTFMERALPSALAPSFQTGGSVLTRGGWDHDWGRSSWTLGGAAYLEPLDDHELDRHKSNHWGLSSRLTLAPLAEERRVVHLGASVEHLDVDGGSRFRYRARPETGLGSSLLNTGRLDGVDDVLTAGVEAALLWGPVSVQAEYIQARLRRPDRPNPTFRGGYVQASWIVTGEARRYSRTMGTFRGVRPKRSWGAIELALRFSTLDLNEETVSGGRARDVTAGINWYLLENLRFMVNYVCVDGKNQDDESDDPHIVQGRVALYF
ncbi:MAG: OprO/OprP family phosphate-selective porin [Myxococcota bacterium]